MSNPLSRVTTRVAYGASQLPRIAWYIGHSLAVRRLSEAAQRQDGKKVRPRAHTNLPVPDRRRLYADMAILLQQDLLISRPAFTRFPPIDDEPLSVRSFSPHIYRNECGLAQLRPVTQQRC